jgi:hypothetical protein
VVCEASCETCACGLIARFHIAMPSCAQIKHVSCKPVLRTVFWLPQKHPPNTRTCCCLQHLPQTRLSAAQNLIPVFLFLAAGGPGACVFLHERRIRGRVQVLLGRRRGEARHQRVSPPCQYLINTVSLHFRHVFLHGESLGILYAHQLLDGPRFTFVFRMQSCCVLVHEAGIELSGLYGKENFSLC